MKPHERPSAQRATTIFVTAALIIVCLVSGAHAQTWRIAQSPLVTRWAKEVSPANALPEYPRPQMVRKAWQSLNGLWNYALSDREATIAPEGFNGRILVPFPYEAALSGVGKPSIPTQKLWYRRRFAIPAAWRGQNVLLHFGAVNYDARVWLNGRELGSHRGGFDGFSFDITRGLNAGANVLTVGVSNPLRSDVEDAQVLGKQRVKPGGIFYTAATGIWQSVWLEAVPKTYIADLKITPDIDSQTVRVSASVEGAPNSNGDAVQLKVEALNGTKTVSRNSGAAGGVVLPIRNPRLWTPDTPFLYKLRVSLNQHGKSVDSVDSYFAMRKISLGRDAQNRTRLFLNNRFLLQVGALDQGYWPDGIYTAPTDAALKYDIQVAKRLGWNMLRKHAKVEPARWYYHADTLGMLVWQDMPQMFGGQNGALSPQARAQFDVEWKRIIAQNINAPSIVVWTTFNEGWGQHETERVVALTRHLDPTRLVNNASGWTDENVGDMHDTHDYPGPGSHEPEAHRAAVNGEFGGVTLDVPDHRWLNNASVMGYGATLKSSRVATKRFQGLMKKAYALKDTRGTSAFVYTQLTDVEQEINGALTYDRALIKMDANIVAAANRGRFLPLPPNPNHDLVPTSEDAPLNWNYTFDKPSDNWAAPDFDAANWKLGAAPFGRDTEGVRTAWTSPDIWIRRDFTLPASIPAKLNVLVKHDEDTEIYINGVLAATAAGYTGDYASIAMSNAARATLREGKNTFAVHVHQTIGGQGIDIGLARAD